MNSGQCQKNTGSGCFPQYGAIFMANKDTRQECFSRRIFGLPSKHAHFVMKIKTGMLLFLFDHQERQLYGVYKASSDGAMNIQPHAYNSAGKQFPAQVRFHIMWRCAPVPEHAFRDVIEENYFAPYKFRFGLSRDQVQRLLFLFEKRKHGVHSSQKLEWSRECQISGHIESSEVETQPGSIGNSELSPKSTSEKPASLGDFDDEIATHLEDYIPLPSVDPEEIEDPLPDGLAGGPQNLLVGRQDTNTCQWQANSSSFCSLFSELGGCISKPNICPSVPQSSDRKEDNDIGHQVQRLYSDNPSKRTSVFLRLTKGSKVTMEEKSHNHDKIDNTRGIMKMSEESHRMWKNTNAKRTQYNEAGAFKKGVSVFSRLGSNVGRTPESQERKSASSGEIKPMCMAEEFPRNLKRKSSCNQKTVPEVEGIIARNEEQSDCLSQRQKKRKLEWKKPFSKNSLETNTCDHSSGILSQGSSASAVDNGCCDASCQSNTNVGRDSNKGDDRSREDSNNEEVKFRSCLEDAIKNPLETYHWRLSGSSQVEDPAGTVSESMCEADVTLKSSRDGNSERELEFIPLNFDVPIEVGVTTEENNESEC